MLNLALVLLLGVQAAAPAQEGEAAAAKDEIIVTGQRLTRETARHYVAEISRPIDGQLPMFNTPICPEVVGLRQDHAARVRERIRKVAKHAGVRVAPEKCRANLHLVVVDDGKKFVSELQRRHSDYFTGVRGAEMTALLKGEQPARAWSNVQIQNEDGLVYSDVKSGSGAFDNKMRIRTRGGEPGTSMLSPITSGEAPSMRVMSASITKQPTRQSTLHSFVVLDAAAVAGKTNVQIADYVAMRGLAAARPPKSDAPVDTILTLFDKSEGAPLSVRKSDVAYLSALYSSTPTANYYQQLVRLSKAIVKGSSEGVTATQ